MDALEEILHGRAGLGTVQGWHNMGILEKSRIA